jgi:hypothetical protein
MSLASLTLPAQLDPTLRMELERLTAILAEWQKRDHAEDGRHATITFAHGATLFEKYDPITKTYRVYTTSSNGTVSGPY